MCKTIALVIVGCCALVFVGVRASAIVDQEQGNEDVVSGPLLSTNVMSIYSEYLTNPARANLEYSNRPLRLEFRVDKIEERFVTSILQQGEFWDSTADIALPVEALVALDKHDMVRVDPCMFEGGTMWSEWVTLDFDCTHLNPSTPLNVDISKPDESE